MKRESPLSRGGRFSSEPGEDVVHFTESVSFDWRLWRQDVLGSMAHATMLRKAGLLTRAELKAIIKGLDQIGKEIEAGAFVWNESLEDVHMNIEAELTRRVPAGAKLHTGRSRNDQVALDLRLWARDNLLIIGGMAIRLQRALLDLAENNSSAILPGYTHLQRAQPVYFAHHLLAYVEMLERDGQRLMECYGRTNVSPLGSGALAGSTLPLDRLMVAKSLFMVDDSNQPLVSRNSIDAVSDRDFLVEFCAAGALLAVHLSRLAEDLILWSSAEFNYVRIGDAYTTGSSLMPQKRNPDVAELARGKSARVIGNLVAMLTLLKGLPMSYNRDLQEDKERVFDTADTLVSTLQAMTGMLQNVSVNTEVCAKAASDPVLLATDLADYLVLKGIPFRQAHHAVGQAVALAEGLGKPLDQLTLDELMSVNPKFEPDALAVFDLKRAMNRRNIVGAPGTRQVKRQLAYWRKRLFLLGS